MKTATIDACEGHSQHIGQIYQEYYAGLRYDFLSQLGDASVADACAHETISRFFVFMKSRRWETEAEHIPAHLLGIAERVCSERSAAKSARHENRLGLYKAAGLLHKIMGGVIQPIKERLELGQLFQGRRAATHARG